MSRAARTPPQTILSPAGETLVVLPLAEYEAMADALDAADHAVAIVAVEGGLLETLSLEEADSLAAATTPLAFWRRHRDLTQQQLAAAAGISQSYIAGLEAGHRKGDPTLFLRLARILRVRMEDLVADVE